MIAILDFEFFAKAYCCDRHFETLTRFEDIYSQNMLEKCRNHYYTHYWFQYISCRCVSNFFLRPFLFITTRAQDSSFSLSKSSLILCQTILFTVSLGRYNATLFASELSHIRSRPGRAMAHLFDAPARRRNMKP